jgi:hypothetical protein
MDRYTESWSQKDTRDIKIKISTLLHFAAECGVHVCVCARRNSHFHILDVPVRSVHVMDSDESSPTSDTIITHLVDKNNNQS